MEEFAGDKHSWACHVNVIGFTLLGSLWMEPLDLPTAGQLEQQLPNQS